MNGGMTHDEVYSMPVYLRYFNLKMLLEQKKKEAEAQKEQMGNNVPTTPNVRPKPPTKKP